MNFESSSHIKKGTTGRITHMLYNNHTMQGRYIDDHNFSCCREFVVRFSVNQRRLAVRVEGEPQVS